MSIVNKGATTLQTKMRRVYQSQAHRYVVKNKERKEICWGKIFKGLIKIAMVCVIIFILGLGIWWVHQHKQQPIEKVQVIATYDHIEPKVLQKIISAYLSDNFFDLNTIGLRSDLLALPWVDKIFIRRKWPNTIIINIEEQRPVARWKDEALFNVNGMLFTPPLKTFPTGLPLLLGPEEDVHDVIENYQKIQKLLDPLNFKITQFDVNERGSWHMILDYNLDVFLGDEDILPRVQNFITAYPKALAENPNKKGAAVDLRYKNGMAIRWGDAAEKL